MYRIGLYVQAKEGHELVKWLDKEYTTQLECALETARLNKEKGINLSERKEGDQFYMYVKR